jgi:hypothetical protein
MAEQWIIDQILLVRVQPPGDYSKAERYTKPPPHDDDDDEEDDDDMQVYRIGFEPCV